MIFFYNIDPWWLCDKTFCCYVAIKNVSIKFLWILLLKKDRSSARERWNVCYGVRVRGIVVEVGRCSQSKNCVCVWLFNMERVSERVRERKKEKERDKPSETSWCTLRDRERWWGWKYETKRERTKKRNERMDRNQNKFNSFTSEKLRQPFSFHSQLNEAFQVKKNFVGRQICDKI